MKKIIFAGAVGLITGFISGAGITYIFCKKKADDDAYSVYKEEVEKFKNRWENTHMVSLTEDTAAKKPEKPPRRYIMPLELVDGGQGNNLQIAEIDSVNEYLGALKNASYVTKNKDDGKENEDMTKKAIMIDNEAEYATYEERADHIRYVVYESEQNEFHYDETDVETYDELEEFDAIQAFGGEALVRLISATMFEDGDEIYIYNFVNSTLYIVTVNADER